MGPVVFASSVAAYDALDDAAGGAAMEGVPSTLYGVYKRANEGTATVYAADRGVASVGLRPHTVYGPGRDQGLTSAPTTAMLAAAAGRPYRLPFGGAYQLQYAPDVAAAFIAAAREEAAGATVRDIGGPAVHTDELIAAIAAAVPGADISYEPVELPFPADTGDAGALPTPLREGVADTVERFRDLLRRGWSVSPRTESGPRSGSSCGLRSGTLLCSRKVSGPQSAGDHNTETGSTNDHCRQQNCPPPPGASTRPIPPRASRSSTWSRRSARSSRASTSRSTPPATSRGCPAPSIPARSRSRTRTSTPTSRAPTSSTPSAIRRSRSSRPAGGSRATSSIVDGDLTIKGDTRPVEARGQLVAPHEDPWGNTRVGITLEAVVDRTHFGLSWNNPLPKGGLALANDVRLHVDLQLVKA